MKLSVSNASFSYKKGQLLLQKLNFSVPSGSLTAILGPNGAGKTTLLRCITGLLKWQQGDTFLDDTPLCDLPARQLWQKLAYVPQLRTNDYPQTALELVLLGRSSRFGLFAQPGKADQAYCLSVMERLKIADLWDKPCSKLSGGQLQMVLIARALAAEPRILVLDEPESNLDFKNQLLVLQTLKQLSASNITCIFNTHYPAHALQYADQALLLGCDHTYLFGETKSVITEPNIRRYFGVNVSIHTIETPEGSIQNVTALSVADNSTETG